MPAYDFIIASYNSEHRIAKPLNSLWKAIQDSAVETTQTRILLINNASTDNTRTIAEHYLDQMPLKIIDAPEPGKSRALNYAIDNHIQGDVIFLSDDDTQFADGWLDTFLTEINAHPDYSVFAGKIVGKWETKIDPDLASWIPMGSTFAIHDRTESGPCEPGLVWGPNKAVRKEVFDAGIRYDERIGPMPQPFYAMGEDTAFAISAARSGFKSYFVANAVVEHTIKAATANEGWVIKRAERLGYGIFAIKTMPEYEEEFKPKHPVWADVLVRNVFWGYLVYPLTYLLPRGKKRFWLRWRKYYYKGLWRGYRDFTA